METITIDKKREKDASLALHNILTCLWGFDNRKPWDEECWILFHNLIILLSFRNKLEDDDWAFRILAYTGEIIPTLEKKQETGITLVTDPAMVIHDFMQLASWSHDAHPKNSDEGIIRIVKAFRKNRNRLLEKMDNAFAYLLTQGNLEVDEPYHEIDLHEIAWNTLKLTSESLGTHYKIQNLQFEAKREITVDDVDKCIFDYYKKKGFFVGDSFMNTATIYDKNNEIICNTSVTVELGSRNSIVMVSLTN